MATEEERKEDLKRKILEKMYGIRESGGTWSSTKFSFLFIDLQHLYNW